MAPATPRRPLPDPDVLLRSHTRAPRSDVLRAGRPAEGGAWPEFHHLAGALQRGELRRARRSGL